MKSYKFIVLIFLILAKAESKGQEALVYSTQLSKANGSFAFLQPGILKGPVKNASRTSRSSVLKERKWKQSFSGHPHQNLVQAPVNFTYGSMGGYYTYQELMDILDSMRARFPQLVSKKDTLGLTYEGRPIVAIRISDNPDINETGEDEWLMTSLHHANEVIGVSVTVYFAWYILEHYDTDKEIKNLLNNSALYFVPVVNPDGLVYNESTNPAGGGTWRKNRKPRTISSTTYYGVDLNRNYGYNWGYTHPGQLGQAGSNFAGNGYYRGTAPWSEKETQAIRDLCNAHRFVAAFNYHAWDDSFNYPWNFDTDSLTADSLKFKAIALYCTENNNFEIGTFNKTLGYTANGTSDDWMYGEQVSKPKIFPFTIEVGKSFWPAQSLIVRYCDSLLHANIKMLRMAAKYAILEETGADTITTLSSYADYSLKRYSIKDTGFTVSIVPLDSYIASVGPPKLYTDIDLLETRADNIPFTLIPSIPSGTVVKFLLKVDNGTWYTIDTVSKVYVQPVVLALDCSNRIESNSSMLLAAKIYPGIKIRAAIEKKGFESWFYFQNSENKKNIRIVLSGLPADYDIELLDNSGKRLAFSNHPSKINDTIVFNASSTGTFWIRVYGYKNAYQPFECFLLETDLGNEPFVRGETYFFNEKNILQTGFSVSPLPAGNYINISVISGKAQNVSWSLYDNEGRQFTAGLKKVNKGTSVFPIDLHYLKPGFYIITIIAGMEKVSFKIIKQ